MFLGALPHSRMVRFVPEPPSIPPVDRGIDGGDHMAQPPQKAEGEDVDGPGEKEEEERRKDAALHQLAQPWDEEAGDGCNDVSSRSFSI